MQLQKHIRRAGAVFIMTAAAVCAPVYAQTADEETRRAEFLRELYETFPDASSLVALRSNLDAEIRRRAITALRDDESLPSFGAEEGALVVEFSDYNCGYCKRMFPLLRDENVRVKVVEFPVLGAVSAQAARYALAAEKQGGYSAFHIALMERGGRLSEEGIREAADVAGLDWERLQLDSESESVNESLRKNQRLANLLEVRGTPFLVIGERTVPGAVGAERLKQLLTEAAQ